MLRAPRRAPAPETQEPDLRLLPGGRVGDEPETPAVNVAEALRDTRTRRRISLERAAADTRISTKALKALEGTGSAEDLPEAPYDRYFLKEYALYLGLDAEPLLSALDHREGRDPEPPLGMLLVEPAPPRWRAIAVGVGCAAALGVLAFLGLTSSRPVPITPSNVAAPPAPPAASQPAGPSEDSGGGTPVTGARAVLRLSGSCWIQATVDGNVVMAETVPEGRTVRFRANRRLDLVLGNAGGVRLTVNGSAVATGDAGEVVRLSFVWKNGRLQAL
jgi:cytoskeleton protein RodZ